MLHELVTAGVILLLSPLADRYFVRPLHQRRARRHQAGRRMLCPVRVVEGEQRGLRPYWWPCRVSVEPGCLLCGAQRLEVREVRAGYREPRLREWLVVNPDSQILTVATSAAVVEIALTAADRAWLPGALSAG